MNLEVGAIVGDYQIIEVLGAGGMGKVFKVRNTISDRIEAMKVLLPDLAGEPELGDRFLREIKVLASLEHPNIAGLRTALRVDNQLLMVMEYVEGVPLDQRLHQGALPVADAVHCIDQVLNALGFAHQKGVVHRDIKPANMMLMPDGTVKLMDFGIAKAAADRKLTMTGTTMGSLYYMSPEQIRGEGIDPRSDLYSVGVSLYELVTGKRPFDGDSQFAIMSAHLEKNPVPPIDIDPKLPQALNNLILHSVNRDPNQRFQNAGAFRNAISGVLLARQAPAAAPAPPPPVAKAAPAPAPSPIQAAAAAKRPNRALWATVGAVCCVGIIVAIIQFGPFKKAAANSPATQTPPAATTTAPSVPTPEPAASTPASTPAPTQPDTTPVAQPAPTPVEKPAHAQIPTSTPVKNAPTRSTSTPAQQAAAPVQQMPVQQPAPRPQAPVVQQPAPQPQAPVVQQPAPQPQQPNQSARRAEMMKLRESFAMVSARASSVHATMQGVQQSQARSGLGMRSDWVQAASLMDSFLQGANDALNAGDAPAARDLMDKAERQLERLEKAFNK